MIEIRFQEKLTKYEDAFLHYLEQPESPEVLQKLAMYGVLYSEALMDEKQASFIERNKRVDQLRQNAQILLNCRVRLVFEYRLGGPVLGAIDETIAAIEKFVAADVS
jgi:hypothetical protein